MSEKLTSALIQTPGGGLFSTLSVDGSGIVIKNASDDQRSDGTFVPAGSDTLVLSAVGESSFLNASYMKVGVLDASLMRTGLLQTVASWNSKWYGSSADSMDVQQGFSGGKFAADTVSTTTNAITLGGLESPSGGSHNITTSDYVRVSGLVFDVSGDDVYGNVGVDSPGSGVVEYAVVEATTSTSVTFKYTGIGSGKSTLNQYSLPFISKAVPVVTVSRVYDDGATDDNPAELSTVTVTTGSSHGLAVGNYVELAGLEDTLNGVWRVASVPSSTTFTFMQRFVEDLDWEDDGSISLPEYGAPVAIEVAKSYRVTSDGTLLAYGAVFNPAGKRRSAILLRGSSTQGDIAVPADETLHIGYRTGTEGLGGSFVPIMTINTPATGNQAATVINGSLTVDTLTATTINGGTAGATIPDDLDVHSITTSTSNLKIEPYYSDGAAYTSGSITFRTLTSTTYTTQARLYSTHTKADTLVVNPNFEVIGNLTVGGTFAVGTLAPETVDTTYTDTEYLIVRNGNIRIDQSVSDGPGSQTRGELSFYTNNVGTYTYRGKIYSAASLGNKLGVDAPLRIVDITAATSPTTGALIVDGGAGIAGKLYVGDTTDSSVYTSGALVVSGGIGVAKDIRVNGQAWFTDVSVSGGMDIQEFNVDAINIQYGATRRATLIGSSAVAGRVNMYYNDGVGDLSFYVSGDIVTTNSGSITSGGQLTASAATETTSSALGSQTGALVVVGGASVGKSLRIEENLYVNGNVFFDAGTVTFDDLSVGTSLSTNLRIQPNGWLTVNATQQSTSTISGAVVIAGGVGIAKDVYLANVRTAGRTSYLDASSVASGGGSVMAGWLYGGTADAGTAGFPGTDVVVTPSGFLTVNQTGQSTSKSSGAVIVAGGVGVAKDIWADNFRTAGTVQAGTVQAGTITGVYNPTSMTVSGTLSANNTSFGSGTNPKVITTDSGIITINNTAQSTSGSTGALVVLGGVGVGSALNIASTANATGTASQASFVTQGGAVIKQNLVVGGTISGTMSFSSLDVNGTLSANNLDIGTGTASGVNTIITNSGITTINNSAQSTSSSTGALVVAGGVGIGSAINIGGTVDATGTASAASFVTNGGAVIKKNLVVGGTISGTMSFTTLNVNGKLSANNAEIGTGTASGVNTIITNSGITTINNGAASTSGSTGALVVAGGVGIQGQLSCVGGVSLSNGTADKVTAVLRNPTTGNTYRTVYITTDTAMTGTTNQFMLYGTSSERYKTNIRPASGDFGIFSLPLKTFNFKHNYDPENPDATTELGFIAEEMAQIPVLQKYVFTHDNQIEGINFERLTIPLVGAVQVLKAEIEQLKQRIAALEASLP